MNLATHTILASALLLSLSLTACSGDDKGRKGPPPAPVNVASVEQRDVDRVLHVVGNVAASATVAIKTRITGELHSVHFKEGQHVEAGQKLFTIDPRPFEATLRETRARLEKDVAQLRKAEDDMRRYGKLVSDGYVSREAYEQAATDAAALRATVQADKAAVESAALQLEYCTVLAPISGRASDIKSDKGNMIKANADEAMLTIDTLTPIYVNFAVPEAYLSAILERQRQGVVNVTARPSGGESVNGELTFISNAVDTRTGTIKLRGTFTNADQRLWPGQFVEVGLTLGVIKDAIIVPARAVQAGRSESYVYIIDENQKAQYRKVRVDTEIGGFAVIMEGLAKGEQVATEGQVRLAPGVSVTIRKP